MHGHMSLGKRTLLAKQASTIRVEISTSIFIFIFLIMLMDRHQDVHKESGICIRYELVIDCY